ncbi:Hsp70 family protein [uncultured Ruminococcus sp.]|uniref:Hsp70 family protein n=1 Tax=uncultured Ruminococcus sp. TaxID=165186 RepID=UPI0025CEC1FC|nr:Hsp70 family protein [uncultured Ruminococcus sp.]
MILGIDLGTTYSVCSYIDEKGEPQVITNMEGQRTTPSVVYFESGSSVVVGQAAKENSICFPDDVVSAIKNHMGDKNYRFTTSDGTEYSPEVISGLILKKLASDANDFLGNDVPVKKAVITIPAYFTDAERTATENAAKIAGLELVRTINEPTAAALYYASSSKLEHGNILVYDLGGGTFDVTVIRVDGKDVAVKSTKGLKNVGGRFFDEEIVDLINDYIDDKYDIDLEDDEYKDVYQELFTRAEKAKISLSRQEKTVIPVRTGEFKESFVLQRADFEKIVAKLYKRTEFCVKTAISDAGLTAKDIDKAILVGGSSRIPYIEENLTKLLGMPLSHEVNPDEVVAMGAALYGKYLENSESEQRKISDVCSHSIGIVALEEMTLRKYNRKLIERNTTLPAVSSLPFKTASESQDKIELSITEGEFKELSDVRIISESVIELPAGLPKGTRVEVEIQLDTSQLVHVRLRIPSVGIDREFKFERLSNMSEQDVEKLTGLIADFDVN